MIYPENVADIVLDILPETNWGMSTNIAAKYQTYPFYSGMWRKGNIKFTSGRSFRRNLTVDKTSSARKTPLFSTDVVTRKDLNKKIEVPFRTTEVSRAWDRREETITGGREEIRDYLKDQAVGLSLERIEFIEDEGWILPTDENDPELIPSIRYWIRPERYNSADGFNGLATIAGFPAGRGGLIHANHGNWAAQYVTADFDDLVKKIRRAMTRCHFRPPGPDMDMQGVPDWMIAAGYEDVIAPLEELTRFQNDRIGPDLAFYDGKVMIRNVPFVWVPALDADPKKPVIGINRHDFKIRISNDWFARRTKGMAPSQHNVNMVWVEDMWGSTCDNLRSHFYLATA